MRISRSNQLHQDSGSIHMYWRCHNREMYLAPDSIKQMYLKYSFEELSKDSTKKVLATHAFCVMNNHFHQYSTYYNSSDGLSNYMRKVQGRFGINYNKLKKRSGKVSESRPKTSLIQNVVHQMRVHFYVESNPLRAGICRYENLKDYRYSSYQFYAYGISNSFTKYLTPPDWYIELGSTPKTRQRRYRKLFKAYLLSSNSLKLKNVESQLFIGSNEWTAEQFKFCVRTKKRNECGTG